MDFPRHRANFVVTCQCGRTISIPFDQVLPRYHGKEMRLEEARAKLRCKRCFKKGEVVIAPVPTL